MWYAGGTQTASLGDATNTVALIQLSQSSLLVAAQEQSMSRTGDLERQERERRRAQSGKLQDRATELKAPADQLWDEDAENGWTVRYLTEPQLTTLVTIDGPSAPLP
jgi:hypothetical protein